MRSIPRRPRIAKASSQLPVGPYRALLLAALLAALRHPPGRWSSGWITLGREGRNYLRDEGIEGEDLRVTIDDGVNAGSIQTRLVGGMPAIALIEFHVAT